MYRSAVRGGLDFYETSSQVKRAILRGELVALRGNGNYVVANVRTPYVRPETKSFVGNLAADYRRACAEIRNRQSATQRAKDDAHDRRRSNVGADVDHHRTDTQLAL